jgi:hypothetical protein
VTRSITHFTLFVRACIECNRRNRSTTVVMVGGQPGMYYVPAPQMVQYPQQYMPAPQMPPSTYAPASSHGGSQHQSMYGGYYQPPAQSQAPIPESKAELHANNAPTSSTPVSSETTDRR